MCLAIGGSCGLAAAFVRNSLPGVYRGAVFWLLVTAACVFVVVALFGTRKLRETMIGWYP